MLEQHKCTIEDNVFSPLGSGLVHHYVIIYSAFGRTAISYQQSAFALFPSHTLLSTFVWTTEKLLVFNKPHLLTLPTASALET